MKEYIKKFVDYMRIQKNYSEHTIENYTEDLEQLSAFLTNHEKTIHELDRKLAREYLSNLYEKKYKVSSVCRKISSIKSFFKFLLAENILKENYFLYLRLPKKDQNIPVFLSQDEMFDLLNSPDESKKQGLRDRAIIEVLYSTGIRVSELVNIKIMDIDLFGEIIKVLGKGRKERIVPIGTNSLKIVKQYIDEVTLKYGLTYKDFLFRNRMNGVLTVRSIPRIIEKHIKKLAIHKKISPHKIRHTFATHLLNQGCDLRSLQEMLGHVNLSTTQIYLHLDIEKLKKDYSKAHPHGKLK
jgi:tyrosine recombinase XerC